MRAAVYRRRGHIEVATIDPPVGEEGRAVVDVDFCGICGTDLHLVVDGWGRPNTVFGHEWSGTVVDPGGSRLSVGDAVVGLPSVACGTCEACAAGRASLCRRRPEPGAFDGHGAFAERIGLDPRRLVRVPVGVSQRHAAYTEPLAVALHATTLSGVQRGDQALVLGAGPIGAAIIAILRDREIEAFAFEPSPIRAALARELGAQVVDELDVPPHPAFSSAIEAAVVFETSGARVAAETGLAQVAPGGMLLLVGTGIDPPRLDANRIILNELRIGGAYNYDADGFSAALELIASSRLPLDRLIEDESVRLEGIGEAMHRLRSGELAGKVLVEP